MLLEIAAGALYAAIFFAPLSNHRLNFVSYSDVSAAARAF